MREILQLMIPMAVFILVFYFLIIRPQKKQEKEVNEMRASIKAGDEIITIGGLIGKVTRVTDDEITIEAGADKVRFNLKKWSLREVTNKNTED